MQLMWKKWLEIGKMVIPRNAYDVNQISQIESVCHMARWYDCAHERGNGHTTGLRPAVSPSSLGVWKMCCGLKQIQLAIRFDGKDKI